MAPFARNKGRSRGLYGFQGASRGSMRGRGKARGRDSYAPRAGNRRIFSSTRVEDQHEDAPEEEEAESSSEDGAIAEEASSPSSDSEDENVATSIVQPYNTLLLSLNSKVQRGEPQKKRRRIDTAESFTENRLLGNEVDLMEEPEDEDDSGIDALGSDNGDVDESDGDQDPFIKHLGSSDNDNELKRKIEAIKRNSWSASKPTKTHQWSQTLKLPLTPGSDIESHSHTVLSINDLKLKRRLKESAMRLLPPFDKISGNLAFSIFHYYDVLFSQRTLANSELLRKLTCLHALNHIFKTRDLVIKDNARLGKEDAPEDVEYRDQGFTRPKVLVILPTRNSCVKYIDTMASLCEPEQQENKKRFQETYASGDDPSGSKPDDFRDLFAGNDDDMFRLGLKFTRKTVKFFAQFYNSDIIFASPLGLRMALGADDPKKQDHDFLSSIEIVVVDQADAMLMQNWEHVEYIFERLNLQPKEAHGCDFSRVRDWYLDGNAKYLRQNIMLSAFNFPSFNRLYVRHMLNVEGKIKFSTEHGGAIVDLSIPVKQTFSRFDFETPVTEPDNRFKYFTTAIVPSLTKLSKLGPGQGHGFLIFLPTYADFVRVRNYLASSSESQGISFGSISEYTSGKDVARARSHFLSGRHSVLLYTERAHHFRRYQLKGVKKVIMYGLPENPIFYKEVVGGYLGASIAAAQLDPRAASVRALFSRLDILKLERTVGTRRYLSMVKEKGGDTFDFI